MIIDGLLWSTMDDNELEWYYNHPEIIINRPFSSYPNDPKWSWCPKSYSPPFRHCPPRGSWRPISLRLRLRMPLEFWKSMPDRRCQVDRPQQLRIGISHSFEEFLGTFPEKSSINDPSMEHCRCPVFWILWSKLRWLVNLQQESPVQAVQAVRPSHGENSPNNDGLRIHKLLEHLITPSW